MSTPVIVARTRRAWRAGVRADAAWLLPGLGCLVLGRWIDGEAGTGVARVAGIASSWVDDIGGVLASDSPALADAWAISAAAAAAALTGVVVIAGCVLALAIVAAALLRRLGPIDPAAMPGAPSGGVGAGTTTSIAGALAAFVVGVFVVRRAIAGGARAADASLAGLTDLWISTLAATLTTMGAAMIVLGAIEGWRSAMRIRRALAPSPTQAAPPMNDGARRRAAP
jgi:hypothetical protein